MLVDREEMQKIEFQIRKKRKPAPVAREFMDKEKYRETTHSNAWDFVFDNVEVDEMDKEINHDQR